MKYLLWFLGIVVLLCLLVFGVQLTNHYMKQREARIGLDALVTQLPELRDFEKVKVVYREFSNTEYGVTCYYARAFIITGTRLSESESLDVYTAKLESLGWMPREKQYETSRVLYYEMNDRIVVRSGEPGVDIKDALDYAQLRKDYQSVIFIRIDYMVPNREEC